MTTLPKTISDKRGAVAAEFVIAFMPLITAFLCFTQAGQLYTAHLVFRHAALAAGRAAITTIGPCMPKNDKHPTSPDDVRRAALAALGQHAWQSSFDRLDVSPVYKDASDAYGDVQTTTKARYKCNVPMGKNIVCQGGFMNLQTEVTLPHQGARYKHAECSDT